ncbi:hypothetical protein M5X02_28660, partial [Paenibacillus alvei]|uniref:hypothetical protein n=1 Tax=Paenibacillus alvei TaxID=44250 RepID=UPI002283AB52
RIYTAAARTPGAPESMRATALHAGDGGGRIYTAAARTPGAPESMRATALHAGDGGRICVATPHPI